MKRFLAVMGRVCRPPAGRKRWSRWKALNIVSGVTILWMVFWLFLAGQWHLGIDPQKTRCLPWSLYALEQANPYPLQVGEIYQYRSRKIGKLMPDGMKVVKYVAAGPGDHVKVDASGISINGHLWGPIEANVLAKAHISAKSVYREYTLGKGKYVVLGTQPGSFDGRYWGTIDEQQVLARAYPIW